MKKLLSIFLVGMLAFSMIACSGTSSENNDVNDDVVNVEIADATELLTTVWDSYGEDEKFAIMGGDYVTMVDSAPGKFDISDTESLDAMLGVPADAVASIDGAASMVHMMNANTFTAGAYHLVADADMTAYADALKENIINRQWMCGFPDTLIIVSVGDEYVVSAFGAADVIENFKTKLLEAYEAADIIYEESLAQ